MLDYNELDKVLDNLSEALCCPLEDWMRSTYDELVEFGSVYMYTDEFLADEYFETLQLMTRFYEKKLDIGRVAMCIKLKNDFLKEKIISIDPHIMGLAIQFICMDKTDKYN